MTKVTERLDGIYYFRKKSNKNKIFLFLLKILLVVALLAIIYYYIDYGFVNEPDSVYIELDNNTSKELFTEELEQEPDKNLSNIENLDEIKY